MSKAISPHVWGAPDMGIAITGCSTSQSTVVVKTASKRRFSELASKAFCHQEDACALQERLDDEPEPVIAQSETLVLKHPRVAALHRPAPLAQSRAGRLTSQVDLRRDTEEAAQIAMVLSVVPFVGEHGADPGHNREGSQEQALEDERIVNIGGGGHARNRHAVSIYCDVVFGPPLGTVGRIGPGEIPCAFGAHRATVQD